MERERTTADREEIGEFEGERERGIYKSIRTGTICVEKMLFIENSASSRALVLIVYIEVATTWRNIVIHQTWKNSRLRGASIARQRY